MKKAEKIAIKAAVAYFGLSSATDDFPKGTKVVVHTTYDIPVELSGFFAELREKIESVWRENIGSLSRTPRLSATDFAHYVNELRSQRGAKPLEVDSSLIEMWMKMMVAADPKVVLVEVETQEGRKLLLVNTGMNR